MMTGVTFAEIRDAIVASYKKADLEELLRTEMNVQMDDEIGPGPFRHQVFELIDWAERRRPGGGTGPGDGPGPADDGVHAADLQEVRDGDPRAGPTARRAADPARRRTPPTRAWSGSSATT